jgi:hypothetical protein
MILAIFVSRESNDPGVMGEEVAESRVLSLSVGVNVQLGERLGETYRERFE